MVDLFLLCSRRGREGWFTLIVFPLKKRGLVYFNCVLAEEERAGLL